MPVKRILAGGADFSGRAKNSGCADCKANA